MKKKTLALIVIISLFILTGCWDRRPVDELGIIANIVIENANDFDDKIKLNIIRPTFEKNKTQFAHKSTVEGGSIMEALDEMQKRGSKVYLLGSVKNVLIGKKVAQGGINEILSQFDHISDFETQALLVILDGTIEQIEEFEPPQQLRTGILILDTIEASLKKQLIPETKFYKIMSIYSLEGREIVLPIIKVNIENHDILVEGMGIFKGDKLVGSIDSFEGLPFMIVTLPEINELIVNVPCKETEQHGINKLSVTIRKKKAYIKTKIEEDIPMIDVEITLTVDQKDFIPSKSEDIEMCKNLMNKESTVKAIERAVSSYLEKQTKILIERTQKEFKSDIFGFGEKVRAQNYEYFKSINWRDVYPKAKITCRYKVILRKLGTVK